MSQYITAKWQPKSKTKIKQNKTNKQIQTNKQINKQTNKQPNVSREKVSVYDQSNM